MYVLIIIRRQQIKQNLKFKDKKYNKNQILESRKIEKMANIFQQFEYRLVLNNEKSNNTVKLNKNVNSDKNVISDKNVLMQNDTINLIINHKSNIHQILIYECKKNNLDLNIVPILIESIQQEINKQRQIYQQKLKKLTFNKFNQKIKPKSFKDKFCKYLTQVDKEDEDNTFRNFQFQDDQFSITNQNYNIKNITDHFDIHNQLISNNQQQLLEEYSFRPYMKILDMADEEYSTQLKEKLQFIQKDTINKQKSYQFNKRTIFDQLYQNHQLIQLKKQLKRKQSFQKLTFKPQLNNKSLKMVQMKRDKNPQRQKQNPYQIKLQKNTQLQTSNIKTNLSSSNIKMNLSSSNIKTNTSKSRITRLSRNTSQQKAQRMNIYERGEVFIKKSKEKLEKIKSQYFQKQLDICTFKPRLIAKSPTKAYARY